MSQSNCKIISIFDTTRQQYITCNIFSALFTIASLLGFHMKLKENKTCVYATISIAIAKRNIFLRFLLLKMFRH